MRCCRRAGPPSDETFTICGHTLVLQEKADNIVKWLDRFKQVGDVTSNADPVHVGLPWAGIRFLLEVSIAERMNTSRAWWK
jgi:ankyrin repeat domain-containing protein 50